MWLRKSTHTHIYSTYIIYKNIKVNGRGLCRTERQEKKSFTKANRKKEKEEIITKDFEK